MQSELFSASQVAFVASVSPSQVAQIGQFISTHRPANGKGYRTGYSFRNIVEVMIVAQLMTFGVTRRKIRQYLDDLGESKMRWLDHDGGDGWIIIDPEWRWAAGTTCDDAIFGLSNHKPLSVIAVDVCSIKKTIKDKISQLGGASG